MRMKKRIRGGDGDRMMTTKRTIDFFNNLAR